MNKKIIMLLSVVTALFLVFTLSGCEKKAVSDNGKIKVVATAFPHYDFVRQIAGEKAELTMLIKPGSEVHTYDPSPSDIAKISACDIFVYTGGESAMWAKSILEGASDGNMKVVSFTDICSPELCDEVSFGTVKETNDHEHHSHNYDEHVWTSPKNAMKLAKKIYKTLCEKDGKNEAVYTENYNVFAEKLSELDEKMTETAEKSKGKTIIVADRFPFAHLVKDYGFEYEAAFPGCSSETEPGAKTVARLSQKVRQENIPVVFTVEFSNKKVAQSIVCDSEAKILTLHSCHNVTNDAFISKITYVELMTQNINNLREALD